MGLPLCRVVRELTFLTEKCEVENGEARMIYEKNKKRFCMTRLHDRYMPGVCATCIASV
jgi:hypothetical protein